MEKWTIILIVAIVVFSAIMALLFKLCSLKKKYVFTYEEDEKIMAKKLKKGEEAIGFLPNSQANQYVHEFIIYKHGRKKQLMCKYNQIYSNISYLVVVFGKKNRLVKVLEINDFNEALTSKPIKLPRKCRAVNLVIVEVEGKMISTASFAVTKKISSVLISLLETIAFICGIYIVRYLFLLITGGYYFADYLNAHVTSMLIMMAIAAPVNFAVVLALLLVKAGKKKKGGAINGEK